MLTTRLLVVLLAVAVKSFVATAYQTDKPVPLIVTPLHELSELQPQEGQHEKRVDAFTKGASHMALLHNVILRGFNSIYLQAPKITNSDDIYSFVGYSTCWVKLVEKHHETEETGLFPIVEETLGRTGVMDKDKEEHDRFLGGLAEFHEHLEAVSSDTSKYNGYQLIKLMDSFKDAFQDHFHNEIADIVKLKDLYSTEDAEKVGPIFAKWGKTSLIGAGLTDVIPFIFYNFDRTVENGRWVEWPPMPRLIYWALLNIGGYWHSDWWRFASCDANGVPQRLLYGLRTQQTNQEL